MRKEEESLTHSHFTATERKEGIVVAIQLFSFSSFSPFPPISHLDLGMKEKRERDEENKQDDDDDADRFWGLFGFSSSSPFHHCIGLDFFLPQSLEST